MTYSAYDESTNGEPPEWDALIFFALMLFMTVLACYWYVAGDTVDGAFPTTPRWH
jgi:hypothetical protein